MRTVILLAPDELTKSTLLGGNIDTDLYVPAIKNAQNTRIKEVLGKELYVKIMDDYENDSLTGIYEEMYEDYIKDMVIFASTEIYLIFGAYKVANNGITKMQSSEGATAVSKEEVDYLVGASRKMYDHYKSEFLKWIKTVDVPEYPKTCKSNVLNVGGWVLHRRK